LTSREPTRERLPSGKDPLPKLVTNAMKAIEAKFEPLKGVLRRDYGIFEPKVLEDLMRLFNSEQIRNATGDVFGRIYEYFLARFSIQKAHDNGEFFTPSSLVQMIVNVIEPNHGKVFDPACGSGGMFVQTSHFIEHAGGDTARKVVFYGQEKNPDTIPIALMNLAVHGLTGEIAEAITYYEDKHGLVGGADFAMASSACIWTRCDRLRLLIGCRCGAPPQPSFPPISSRIGFWRCSTSCERSLIEVRPFCPVHSGARVLAGILPPNHASCQSLST